MRRWISSHVLEFRDWPPPLPPYRLILQSSARRMIAITISRPIRTRFLSFMALMVTVSFKEIAIAGRKETYEELDPEAKHAGNQKRRLDDLATRAQIASPLHCFYAKISRGIGYLFADSRVCAGPESTGD